MTNAELLAKIKAEIERLKVDYLNRSYTFVPTAMQQLLEFIDTLESEKPVHADLEEAAEKHASMHPLCNGKPAKNSFIAGAKWQKEQMMKASVEGEICIPNVWVEHKEGKELVARAEISKELGFKFGDKVRIIIIKEDKS